MGMDAWTDREPDGRYKVDRYRIRQKKRLYVIVSNIEVVGYGGERSKTYTSPSEAARAAQRLARQNKLGGILYADIGELQKENAIETLLADAGIERLSDAK
jgi:hypothetical protein